MTDHIDLDYTTSETESEYEDYDDSGQKKVMDIVQQVFWNETDNEQHANNGTGRYEFVQRCRQLGTAPVLNVVTQLGSDILDLPAAGLRPKELVALGHALRFNTVTKQINLHKNVLAAVGGVPIIRGLANNKNLTTLCLSECRLGRECAYAFSTTVPSLSNLKTLDLAGNAFGDIGGAVVAESMRGHRVLSSLNLSNNQLGHKAAESISLMLLASNNLSSLDISWNNMMPTSVAVIVNSLSDAPKLTTLSLAWNGAGQEGTEALITTIAKNTTLTRLDLAACRLDPTAIGKLAEALQKNNTLSAIKLDSNPMGQDTDAVNKVLKNHKSISLFSMNNCNANITSVVSDFDDVNPGGHYTLDLSNAKERKTAQRLSELGAQCQGECWRNETLDGVRFTYPKDFMWATPNTGKLEVDFVVLEAPDGEPMSHEDFNRFMATLKRNFTDSSKMILLRNATTAYYFDSLQALTIVQMFSFDHERISACVTLWPRIIDRQHAAMMISHALNPESRLALMKKLGPNMMLNKSNLTGQYVIDLSKISDRKVLNELWTAGFTRLNHGFESLRLDGSHLALPDFTSLPQQGILEFTFSIPKTDQENELGKAMMQAVDNMKAKHKHDEKKNAAAAAGGGGWNGFNAKIPKPAQNTPQSEKDVIGDEAPRTIYSRPSSRASSHSDKKNSTSVPSSRPTSSRKVSRPPSEAGPKRVTTATQSRMSRRNSEENLLTPPLSHSPRSIRSPTPADALEDQPAISQIVKPRKRASSRTSSSGRVTPMGTDL